jgi:AcrR family transcriptional regulator
MPASGQKSPDGRQVRWDRHNQERRSTILAAAIGVVEASEPGAEVHVQQIAERAGLSRTVVYRHFTDRADLDRAVQAEILDGLWAELLPAVTLDGTIIEIIERVVSTYVGWAVAHPALHRLAERDSSGDGGGPLQQGLERIAGQVVDLITTATQLLELDLDDDQRAGLDPLVFAIVGAVFSAVRRWMSLPARTPAAPVLVGLVTQTVWHILDGHARSLGVVLDPHRPVQELFAAPGSTTEVAT